MRAGQPESRGNKDLETAWPRGPLHAPLRARLLDELSELTTELQLLRQSLGRGHASAAAESALLSRSRESGWVLGVLSAAQGSDLLFSRQEPAGLEILIGQLRGVLALQNLELAATSDELPVLNPGTSGWEVPWAIANALFVATQEANGPVEWSCRLEEGGLVLRSYSEAGQRLTRFATDLSHALQGCVARLDGSEWSLHFSSQACQDQPPPT